MEIRLLRVSGAMALLVVAALVGLATACGPAPTATPAVPTSTPTATPTRIPTATPTVDPFYTPPPEPSPTPTPSAASQAEFQAALAKHLRDIGAVLYWSTTCPHCAEQKRLFGDAVKYLRTVECMAEYRVCVEKGISAVPTWEIGRRQYVGVRPLDELAQLSGYTGPRP